MPISRRSRDFTSKPSGRRTRDTGPPSYELRESQWRAEFERDDDWFCYVAESRDGHLVEFTKGTRHDGRVPGYEGELNKIYEFHGGYGWRDRRRLLLEHGASPLRS